MLISTLKHLLMSVIIPPANTVKWNFCSNKLHLDFWTSAVSVGCQPQLQSFKWYFLFVFPWTEFPHWAAESNRTKFHNKQSIWSANSDCLCLMLALGDWGIQFFGTEQ